MSLSRRGDKGDEGSIRTMFESINRVWRAAAAASAFLLAVIASQPVHADALRDWQAGYDAEQAGNPVLAIENYSNAIMSGELNQRSLARVFRSRGNAYHAASNNVEALNDYNTAIGLDPAYTLAYVSRGVIYHEAGEFERAIADYDEAAFLDPDYALTFANRGGAYEQLGRTDEAVADFRRAYDLGLTQEWLVQALTEYNALP